MSLSRPVRYRDFQYIEFRIEDGAARIVLNRPLLKNAFLPAMYREIGNAVRACEFDESVDVIVFEGAGGDFSSGGDLGQVVEYLDELDAGDPTFMYEYTDSLPFEIVLRNSKVTIAKVEGWCAGGGLMLTSSSDIVVAAETARFAVLEGRGGIAEPLSYQLLTRRISPAKANLMIYTGDAIAGVEAERIGLVSIVVPAEQLEETVIDLIRRVRKTTPDARRHYKEYAAASVPVIPFVGPCMPLDAPDIHERLRGWARG